MATTFKGSRRKLWNVFTIDDTNRKIKLWREFPWYNG